MVLNSNVMIKWQVHVQYVRNPFGMECNNLIYDHLHQFLTPAPPLHSNVYLVKGQGLVGLWSAWKTMVRNSLCKAVYIYYPVDAWVLPTLNFTVHC